MEALGQLHRRHTFTEGHALLFLNGARSAYLLVPPQRRGKEVILPRSPVRLSGVHPQYPTRTKGERQ
jgi:hypothetical protein